MVLVAGIAQACGPTPTKKCWPNWRSNVGEPPRAGPEPQYPSAAMSTPLRPTRNGPEPSSAAAERASSIDRRRAAAPNLGVM
jgi:hypothetical protein